MISHTIYSLEAFCGQFVDLEAVVLLKSFFNTFGCSNTNYFNNINFSPDFRFSYVLNSTIVGLEICSFAIMIGIHLRTESPLLNSRVRKNYLNSNLFNTYVFGLGVDYLTYPVSHLGNSFKLFYLFIQVK